MGASGRSGALGQTREALTGMGVPPGTADLFVEMYGAFDAGNVIPESPGSAKVASTTFRVFTEQTLVPALAAMGKSQG